MKEKEIREIMNQIENETITNQERLKDEVWRINKLVGGRISSARRLRGLSLEQVAGAVGLNAEQLHKYEVGSNTIPVGVLLRIARVIGRNVSYFYEGVKE